MTLIFGIFLFGICSFLFSVFIVARYERLEKTELASYITLFAWGSLLFGLLVSRFSPGL